MAEIECQRVIAMATNFGTKIAINRLYVDDIDKQLVMRWVWVVIDRTQILRLQAAATTPQRLQLDENLLVNGPTAQDLISAGTHGNSVPLLFDSGTAVPTEMNGPTGTQSSQQFPQDFRSLTKIYVTYTRQHTQSNYSSFRQSKRR